MFQCIYQSTPTQVASVKNFQLCERNDQDHIMQFGRIEGRHSFTIDVSRELSLLLLVHPDDMNFTHRFPYSIPTP